MNTLKDMGEMVWMIDDLSSKSIETRRYISKFLSKYPSKIKGKWKYFPVGERVRECFLSSFVLEVLRKSFRLKGIGRIYIIWANDVIDNYKIFHLTISAYSFFPSAQSTVNKIDHILGLKWY